MKYFSLSIFYLLSCLHIKFFRLVFTCFFVVFLSFAALCFFSVPVVFAESISPSTPSPSVVDYLLPYPGLLPDNSFYFLKVLRDRIEGFLISKPLNKAEFNLLQSDKRIEAAYMLLNEHNGKIDLAISTFSKGQNYFDEGIENIKDAKKQGMDIRDLQKRFLTSQAKHREVLSNMERMVPLSDKDKFFVLEKRLKDFSEQMIEWKKDLSK